MVDERADLVDVYSSAAAESPPENSVFITMLLQQLHAPNNSYREHRSIGVTIYIHGIACPPINNSGQTILTLKCSGNGLRFKFDYYYFST
jgi:hypothetical protein